MRFVNLLFEPDNLYDSSVGEDEWLAGGLFEVNAECELLSNGCARLVSSELLASGKLSLKLASLTGSCASR